MFMRSFIHRIIGFTFIFLLFAGCGNKKNNDCKAKKLDEFPITAGTGEKPQSKVWQFKGEWRTVLADKTGTWIWLLKGNRWEKTLHLSDSVNVKADVLPVDDVVHILLFNGRNTQLVSVEYDSDAKRYEIWSRRPQPANIDLEKESETATIAIDGEGKMWVASDGDSEMYIRWSNFPYGEWSEPVTVAKGIHRDDICAVTSFPDGNIGIFWSNQNTQRFGFKIHKAGDNPGKWTEDEIPASGSALNIHKGMADDHINFAVASDGTLYVAVKTSYDTEGYPLIGLLLRHPDGKWDKLYNVDDEGSRAIVLLSKKHNCIFVVYSSYRDHEIVCKISNMQNIKFSERVVLIDEEKGKNSINNVTGPKYTFKDEVVIVASENGTAKSMKVKCER